MARFILNIGICVLTVVAFLGLAALLEFAADLAVIHPIRVFGAFGVIIFVYLIKLMKSLDN